MLKTTFHEESRYLDPNGAAGFLGLSLASLWRGVAQKTIPAPFYPTARSPRWSVEELTKAIEATRALPAEQKATRRALNLVKQAG